MDIATFIDRFGKLDDFCIEFFHNQILHQDNTVLHSDHVQRDKAYIPPTDARGEKLITLLNHFRLAAKRNYEEHGLHTLFLSIGRVKWKESSVGLLNSGNSSSEYDYDAPLLLIPIFIEEQKDPKKTVISLNQEAGDITFNKVLSLFLQKEYKASSVQFSLESEEDWLTAYEQLCQQVSEVFSELELV
jgi:hypothetical protein